VFHGLDENHTVPPEFKVPLLAVFFSPVPRHRPSQGGCISTDIINTIGRQANKKQITILPKFCVYRGV